MQSKLVTKSFPVAIYAGLIQSPLLCRYLLQPLCKRKNKNGILYSIILITKISRTPRPQDITYVSSLIITYLALERITHYRIVR